MKGKEDISVRVGRKVAGFIAKGNYKRGISVYNSKKYLESLFGIALIECIFLIIMLMLILFFNSYCSG